MISKSMFYRIYNDSVVVLIDIKTNRLIMLQDRWFDFFRKCMDEHTDALVREYPEQVTRFMELGIIDRTEKVRSGVDSDPPCVDSAMDMDLAAFHYFAFRNELPVTAHFCITNRCNLSCIHCYNIPRADLLDTKEALRIIDELCDNGVFFIVITGGEFFLRKDALEILNHLWERKFLVRIDTNGTLIDEPLLRNLQKFRNIRFHISLYSVMPEIHDRITGVEGSQEKTLKTVKALTMIGFRVRLNCAVMKENFTDFINVKHQIADKLNIPIRYNPHLFPRDDGSRVNLTSQLSEGEIEYVKKISEGLDREQYLRGSVGGKFRYCKAGFSFFSINNGEVYPCPKMKGLYHRPLGNLLNQSFSEIWKSSSGFLELRKQVNEKMDGCRLCDE